MEIVPSEFEHFIARHFGSPGREWLDRLPGIVDRYRLEWHLDVGRFLRGGLMSASMDVQTAEGGPAVLKINGPWTPPRRETLALTLWAGGPTPRLLRADEAGGALLLERIYPGEQFAGGTEEQDIERVGVLLAALHAPEAPVPATEELPSLAEVVEEQIATAGAEAAARSVHEAEELQPRLDTARGMAADLEGSWNGRPVLLHGDFENKNILTCTERGLAAIDPLPCLGDPAYDAGYWAVGDLPPEGADRRCELLARTLELDPKRVRGWASVVALEQL
jgi:streptomycin 6-kinase